MYMCNLHPTTAVRCGAHAALRYAASRCAHDLRRALDVNTNGTRMHNRVIVYARVYDIYVRRFADVSGAAARMQRLVGVIAHELVVACSTGSGYNTAQRSMRIYMGAHAAMGYRIQGAGCRMQVQGELVMLRVYLEL